MTALFVIDPQALTIAEDTLIRSEDSILTFANAGSVGGDLAHKTREAAEAMLEKMIADREEEAAANIRAADAANAFRARFRNFRAAQGN